MIKTKLIPHPKLLKKTERIFNEWVRNRDRDEMCISCGKPGNQAGHWIAVSKSSFLRFHPDNVNIQCGGCNGPLKGNPIRYRIGLVRKIGEDRVKELERLWAENRAHKWSRADLESIISKYKL